MKRFVRAILLAGLFLVINFFARAQPVASFVINAPSPTCNPASISFTNTSTGDAPLSYLWLFGNSSLTDTVMNPSFISDTCGVFDIVLIVTDSSGFTDKDTQLLQINCPPVAGFSFTPAVTCNSGTVVFTDESSPQDSVISWLWDFGDPSSGTSNTSTLQNPDHHYDTAGVFPTTLSVTLLSGCSDSVTKSIVVSSPHAFFTLSDTVVCAGDSVFFTDASEAQDTLVDWAWNFDDEASGNNTAASQNAVHVYTEPGVYFPRLVITSENECTGNMKKKLTVLSLPSIDAGESESICPLDSVQLFATGGITYEWTPGSLLNDSTISDPFGFPLSTSVFFVAGTDSNGCKGVDSVTVNVLPLPPADAGNDTSICIGTSATLHASGGISFQWSPDVNISNDTISNPVVSPLITTTYTVTVKDSSGCVATDSITVSVAALPVVTITGFDSSYCGNIASVELTATPGGGLFSGDGVTGNFLAPQTLAAGGSYSINYFYVDSVGCAGSDTAFFTILQPPFVSISVSDSSLCLNGIPVEIIRDPAGGFLSGTGIVDTTFDPVVAGSPGKFPVYYKITDSAGCSNTDTLDMVVLSLPLINAGDDTTICYGDTIQLSASGGITYAWSPDSTLSNSQDTAPFAFPLSTTEYILFGTDTNGCSNIDTLVITVFSLSNVDAGPDAAICFGDTTQLHATGGVTYSWSPVAGLSDTSSADPLASPSVTTTYTVSVNDGTNCPAFDSVTLTVHLLPDVIASPDSFLCFGDSIQLFVAGALSYVWQPDSSLSNNQVPDPLAFPGITTQYVVAGTDSNSCINTDSVMLTVLPLPFVEAGIDTTICYGDTIQLLASGGNMYVWSPDSTLSNSQDTAPFAFPLATTEYILFGTDTNGCSNIDTVTITVFSLTNVDAGSDAAICFGDTTQLHATGGATYSWSPVAGLSDSSSADPLASPSVTTTYTVSVNDGTNCPAFDSITLTVHLLPDVIASPDSFLCFGDSIQLFVAGALSYVWQPDSTLSNNQVPDPLAFPGNTTLYVVAGTDSNSCTNTDSVMLTVLPLPFVDAGIDTTICQGDSLQLNVTGANSFLWSPATSLTNDSIPNPVAFPDSTIMYSVTGTDISGCSHTDSITIFVLSPGSVDAGNDTSICFGDSITLQASGGTSYSWSPSAGLNDTTIANPTASPLLTTVYTVTVNAGPDCTFSDSVMVTVMALPDIDAGTDTSICPGDSAQLLASGGNTYSWSPTTGLSNSSIANPFAFPFLPTEYIVTGTDINGCKNNDTVLVLLLTVPVADAGVDTSLCLGDSITLHATGGTTYEWSPQSGLSNSTVGDPIASPAISTQYIVKVNDGGSCFGYDTVNVVVNPLPNANAGNDSIVCIASSVQLQASGGIQYEWSPINGLSDPGISNPMAIIDSGITYNVLVTDVNNCSAIDSIHFNVVPPLNSFVSSDTTICKGTSVQLFAGGGIIYHWSPAEGLDDASIANPVATPDTSVVYEVIVSDGICYSDTQAVVVSVSSPEINAGTDAAIGSGENYQLNATGSAGTYQWSPSEGLSCVNCLNPSVSPPQTTTYTVTVTDAFGCTASDDVIVSTSCGEDVVYIPNAFTPNTNGKNDVFLVRSFGGTKLNYLRVFDRWGNMIFESNDINTGWDGTYKNKQMAPGVYIYLAEAECANGEVIRKEGNVTLLR